MSFLLRSSVLTLVFLCGLFVLTSSSLWFLRALVEQHSTDYIVGYKSRFIRSNSIIKDTEQRYTQNLPGGVGNFNRFVYARGSQGEYVVGIPKLLHVFTLPRELKSQSFNVRQIGWIVLAQKNGDTANAEIKQHANIFAALGATLFSVVRDGLPAHAQFIFQNRNSESGNFTLYVEEKKNYLHAVIHSNSPEFVGSSAKRIQDNSPQLDATFISLQSNLLPLLPSGFLTAIENKISEHLVFTKTRPNILQSILTTNESLILFVEGSTVAIGVNENNDKVASLVHGWMRAEQGTRHPQKKAFALPDKTIGYEYVPGSSNAQFSLAKGSAVCLPSEDYDEQLFLCGKDKVLVLSNSEQAGIKLVTLVSDTSVFQQGVIRTEVLEGVGLASEIEKFEYIVQDNVTEIWADLKTK